jgi:hypothetical protein
MHRKLLRAPLAWCTVAGKDDCLSQSGHGFQCCPVAPYARPKQILKEAGISSKPETVLDRCFVLAAKVVRDCYGCGHAKTADPKSNFLNLCDSFLWCPLTVRHSEKLVGARILRIQLNGGACFLFSTNRILFERVRPLPIRRGPR